MITPVPTHTPPLVQDHALVGDIWAQWFNGLRKGVNSTPGNTVPLPFANLPQPVLGQVAVVTDSTVNTWGAVVSGGGAFTVLAWWTGSQWTVIGNDGGL